MIYVSPERFRVLAIRDSDCWMFALRMRDKVEVRQSPSDGAPPKLLEFPKDEWIAVAHC